MKLSLSLLIATAFMATSISASAAYSYTYVNSFATIASQHSVYGDYVNPGPTVFIQASYLFQDKLEANRIYNRNDISGWSLKSSESGPADPVTSWTYERNAPEGLIGQPWLKTNSLGEITDWYVLSAFGGHTAWYTGTSEDYFLRFTVDTIVEGNTTTTSNWTESFVSDPVVYNFNDEIIPLPVPGPPTTVPEPETYAMLIAGLGLVGYSARRRLSHK